MTGAVAPQVKSEVLLACLLGAGGGLGAWLLLLGVLGVRVLDLPEDGSDTRCTQARRPRAGWAGALALFTRRRSRGSPCAGRLGVGAVTRWPVAWVRGH